MNDPSNDSGADARFRESGMGADGRFEGRPPAPIRGTTTSTAIGRAHNGTPDRTMRTTFDCYRSSIT